MKTVVKKTVAKVAEKKYNGAFKDDDLGNKMYTLKPENFNYKKYVRATQ